MTVDETMQSRHFQGSLEQACTSVQKTVVQSQQIVTSIFLQPVFVLPKNSTECPVTGDRIICPSLVAGYCFPETSDITGVPLE